MARWVWVALLMAILIAVSFGAGFLLSAQSDMLASEEASRAGPPATTTASTTTTTETTRSTTTASLNTTSTTVPPAPENPWAEERVIVMLEDSNASRPIAPLLNRTLEYWEENAGRYGDYQINFVFRRNAIAPDIRVRLVNRLPRCGDEEDDVDTYLGCAPLLETGTRAERPEIVRIVVGYDNETTLTTLKHEFGHVLGIEHGNEPMPIMAKRKADAARQPAPDATERRYPFRTAKLDVYVGTESFDVPESVLNEQVNRVIKYFDTSADGNVPALLFVERTNNISEAEIVIRGTDRRLECFDEPTDTGSCGPVFGYDPDDDGALEYYTNQTITIKGIDAGAIGWHVGFHLAYALNGGEHFYPFQTNASYDLRRNWWQRVN